MSRIWLITLGLLGLAAALAAYAADEAAEEDARRAYVSAFEAGLKDEERIGILEKVAKDYADTRWADDALWVLGEVADKSGDRRRAILFRRQLLEREALPALERLTCSLRVYSQSRVPNVLFVVERTGHLYRISGDKLVRFNPIPMVTCEELALDYEALGLLELALREYRRAITAAPPGGLFRRVYTRRAERLQRKIDLLKQAEQDSRESESTEPMEPSPPDQQPLEDAAALSENQEPQNAPPTDDSESD